MPKKSSTARSGAQRNRPRVQRNFELVRPTSAEEQEPEVSTSTELAAANVPTASVATATPVATVESSQGQKEKGRKENAASSTPVSTSTEAKASTASRPAVRRQVAQKVQQRTPASLITPEHYAYVRKDLIFIAILAAIMFSVIIILHFVPGIGS
jgi:hypothetical protein